MDKAKYGADIDWERWIIEIQLVFTSTKSPNQFIFSLQKKKTFGWRVCGKQFFFNVYDQLATPYHLGNSRIG